MKRVRTSTLLCLITLWFFVMPVAGATEAKANLASSPQDASAMVTILVTIHQPKKNLSVRGGNPAGRYGRRSQYQKQNTVEDILRQLASDYDLTRDKGWLMQSLGVYCEVFQVSSSRVADVVRQLNADPRVDAAQRMQTFTTRTSNYDDVYYDLQHGLHRMRVGQSHAVATGVGARVAVIDSGVEKQHPDLSRAMINEDFTDQDGRAAGYHGTGMAGVIAAQPNNAIGIVGVAPGARVVDLRACWGDISATTPAQCNTFSLARALDRAIELDVDVINLSLAGPDDALLRRLIESAYEAGIFVVAANRPGANNFPASLPFVLGVDADSVRSGAVAAPGTDVMTTLPEAKFGYLSGSSLATAHVAGVAALLKELNPQLSAPQLLTLFRDQPDVDACHLAAKLNPQLTCH